MFKSLKLYTGQQIRLEEILSYLTGLGYRRQTLTKEEGDFSIRGEILDIFPAAFECPVRIILDYDKIESINSVDPQNYRVLWKHQLIIILPSHKPYRHKTTVSGEDLPLSLFLELKKGDLVAHTSHGIGRFIGRQENSFVIEYANKEKLFVPAKDCHLIQKFIGLKGARPKINRLGTNEWQKTKNRVRKGIAVTAVSLLRNQAQRAQAVGFSFSKDAPWQKEFEETFPYQETPDQIKAAQEVKKDMENPHPMDRLLCGDVGYGKTEVAMRAAFKAVMDNKQVAILAPTTILAEQHYQNFRGRLSNFPVNIQMLSRFKSKARQKTIIEDLKNGKIDIIIGTHRLLSNDIAFSDLGLLIIDEEQRFGVLAKERLKSLKVNLDILTLTATPIPRTLYMGIMGLKDISTINTPPQNRIPISTYVVEYDTDIIRQAIAKELKREGQVFFVHNRIYDIEEICGKIKGLSPDQARIAYAHGKMPEKELEEIMIDFINHEIDCLVSTSIISSGIDIPSANTLIVNNAHNFGLAELHQLRGRVGRFNRKAYAYFLVSRDEPLSELSRKKLETVRTHSELGSGFNIAMEDMEIRGVGNLLGYQQHGYIQAIGFDLYCRLLKETVELLKNTSAISQEDLCAN